VASKCSIDRSWLLKSVLPVAESHFNKEMRTSSRIRAHQSTSETINTSLWRRKTKPTFVNYFAIVVQATKKTCGAFQWRGSFLCCKTAWIKNNFSSQCRRIPISF